MKVIDRSLSLGRPEASARPPGPARRPWWRSLSAVLLGTWIVITGLVSAVTPVLASPGLCVGPVCADQISRSAKHHWQLRLRLVDQAGHRERITVDCRDGRLSPDAGSVDRSYGSAVARRACRL